MTETDWDRCEDLLEMLDELEDRFRLATPAEASTDEVPPTRFPPSIERKLRLFACACCHRIWHLLVDDRLRRTVLMSERFADGEIHRDKMSASWLQAVQALMDSAQDEHSSGFFAFLALFRLPTSPSLAAVWAGWEPESARQTFQTIMDDPSREFSLNWGAMPRMQRAFYLHRAAVSSAIQAATETARVASSCIEGEGEMIAQVGLLRDIFANPFRSTSVKPEWLGWSNRTVENLARSIYKERSFEDMPILADALEDAGCDDRHLLAHCRGGLPHVRGCWALDLLLAKG